MNRKITTAALLSIFLASGAMAQTFSDDFEAYSAGDYIGANSADWTTWSGTTGGTEDAQVVTNNANGGSNSIYFSTTVENGGPQDVVLPFGGIHNTGMFTFETWMNVESGKGAYFNFQGTGSLGAEYAIDCQLTEAGDLTLSSGGLNRSTASFSHDTWFKINITADLNTNSWELLIDDVSQGTFTNATYQVASLDLFPVNNSNNSAGFWIDDISYNHTVYTPTALNASVVNLMIPGAIAGTDQTPTIEVRNLGTTNVTSFDIEVLYDGATITKSVTGENIAQNGILSVDMDDMITLAGGINTATATISNINGGADDFAGDNVKSLDINAIVPALGKMVVGEEATGTWCGWCPRGAVALDNMEENYHDYFIGIAVHNGDPMTHDVYDAGIGTYIGGYPSGLVDRQGDIDPGDFEGHFLDRIISPTVVTLVAGAEYNATNDSLKVSITSTFIDDATGNYKMALVITEDGLTGTASDWNQSNYYSGGGSGDMGGYESLANPVPAAQMVYDHVARTISPSFAGYPNVFPASVTNGEVFTRTFLIPIDSEWDLNEISVVGMVMSPDGLIENATKATLTDAIVTGYTDGLNIVGLEKFESPETAVNLYPNPANDQTTMTISSESKEAINISIVDMDGKVVYTSKVAANNGTTQVVLSTKNFAHGIYNVKVEQGQSLAVRKLVVQ
jgi:hypothetical protein